MSTGLMIIFRRRGLGGQNSREIVIRLDLRFGLRLYEVMVVGEKVGFNPLDSGTSSVFELQTALDFFLPLRSLLVEASWAPLVNVTF